MNEEKKSDSSWEEAEQVGPYQLHEPVPQDEHSRGELFRATNQTSGATALVFRPAEDGSVPLTDWRVRCTSSSSPGYIALEVEQTPWAIAPDKQSMETLVFTLEGVRDAVNRMAQAFSDDTHPSRLRWRLGLALAGSAAVCALLFPLVRMDPVCPPPVGLDHLVGAEPTPMSDGVPTNSELFPTGSWIWNTQDAGWPPVLARPFPSKPYKGQRLPPCKPRVEVEIMGACWVPHELKAPCPEDLYEHQGKCYTASMRPPTPPQSLGE